MRCKVWYRHLCDIPLPIEGRRVKITSCIGADTVVLRWLSVLSPNFIQKLFQNRLFPFDAICAILLYSVFSDYTLLTMCINRKCCHHTPTIISTAHPHTHIRLDNIISKGVVYFLSFCLCIAERSCFLPKHSLYVFFSLHCFPLHKLFLSFSSSFRSWWHSLCGNSGCVIS